MKKHPTVQAHAAELSRLFVGCINEVLENVGVADRLDPEGPPADLVAFVERVRNDALDEAVSLLKERAHKDRSSVRQDVLHTNAGLISALKS